MHLQQGCSTWHRQAAGVPVWADRDGQAGLREELILQKLVCTTAAAWCQCAWGTAGVQQHDAVCVLMQQSAV